MIIRQTAPGEPIALAISPRLASKGPLGQDHGGSVGSALSWLLDALIEGLVHFACAYQTAHPDLLDCLEDLRARRLNPERPQP